MTTIDEKKLVDALHHSCSGDRSYWARRLDDGILPLKTISSVNSLSIPVTEQVSY